MVETFVREPYQNPKQQQQSAMMGMYVFLGSEIMLFGALMVVAGDLRLRHPFDYVQASSALHFGIGGLNTLILLTSSLMVALAVDAGRKGEARSCAFWLVASSLLGCLFLAIKAFEYRIEFAEGVLPLPGVQSHFFGNVQHLFMDIYLVATALHAFHLAVGILLLIGLAVQVTRKAFFLPQRSTLLMGFGLYWHFVDVVWVFLYPVLYLAR